MRMTGVVRAGVSAGRASSRSWPLAALSPPWAGMTVFKAESCAARPFGTPVTVKLSMFRISKGRAARTADTAFRAQTSPARRSGARVA